MSLNSEDLNTSAGRWTPQEHQKFILGLQLFGKNWKKIQEMVGTRSCSQIRSHAQKYFLRLKKQNNQKLNFTDVHQKSLKPQIPSQTQTVNIKQQQPNCSYFMNKILEYTRSHENLYFWDALIDSKPIRETVQFFYKELNKQNMTIQENKKQKG